MNTAHYRVMTLRKPEVDVRICGDVIYLKHPEPLQSRDADLVAMLERCCDQYAHQPFLAERENTQWRSVTFSDFYNRVQRCAAALQAQGAGANEHIGLLARNGIDNAVVHFAVLALGAVIVPLSPAYLLHPQGAAMLGALAAKAQISRLVHDDDLPDVHALGIGEHTSIARLLQVAATDIEVTPIAQRRRHVNASNTAKIFFTSGSTGTPKVVRLTHRMLVSAAAALDQISPQMPRGLAATTVDWLPWTHTFGGNVHVHAALMRGKTLYIDGGAPVPGRFDTTIRNLHDVCPTEFSSVPAAYPMLLQALEEREEFARRFFSRVRTCSFGGAALNPSLVQRLQEVAVRTCGERILFGGGYGMTETCGLLTLVYWCAERTDLLGLPTPGAEMKLVRIEDGRWECRVRGPYVFAGYAEGFDSEVFDDEGYFITGDAVEFASAGDPAQGLVFAGRIKEDFKLANGTWVRAGPLREALLDRLRPHAADLIIVGENRDEVAALVWQSRADGLSHGALIELCRQFNADRHTATQRVARLCIGDRPPDASAGELTAKGTINVRRLLDNRRQWIDEIYSSVRYRL